MGNTYSSVILLYSQLSTVQLIFTCTFLQKKYHASRGDVFSCLKHYYTSSNTEFNAQHPYLSYSLQRKFSDTLSS